MTCVYLHTIYRYTRYRPLSQKSEWSRHIINVIVQKWRNIDTH